MIVIGHRGAAGHAPENTLASIARALAFGVDGVEIDVRLLDGRLIVLHDETLERTTNGRGPYKRLSFEALRALDAGRGERVPTLEEVLNVIGEHADLNVEVKEAGIAAPVTATIEAATAGAPDRRRRMLLSSFDRATTRELAARRGDMRLGVLYDEPFDDALARAVSLGAWSLHLPLADVTAERVACVHDRELLALVYTVNEPPDILRCAEARVDGVFSDFPDRVIAFNRGLRT